MNDSRRKGLLRLRHLREVTEAKGEEMAAERVRFQGLADDTRQPRAVSSFNLFQTPEPLADRMVRLLGDLDGCRVLEPSAGLGRLYRAIRYRSPCPVVLVEQAAQCCAELYREIQGDETARLIQGDFLEQTPEDLGTFDRVLMNPPFKMWRDIKHIRHARRFLSPGGKLVALCANGPRQQVLRAEASEWIDLEPGTFKSEGTRVNVALLVMQ